MRFKIATALLLLIIIGIAYTALTLPFVTDTTIYKDFINGYAPFIYKGLSILMLLVSAYLASLFVSLILSQTFARVIKSNALAKKIFPLIDGTITVAIWIITGFYVLSALGININTLVTGAGVWGLLFALASKEFVSNLFGSLSLIFSHNFKIHDSIRVKGYEGVVEEISLSYTKLVDKKGTVIFMPNKLIISETIENLSMSPTKKAEFTVELPMADTKEIRKTLETIEKEVKKLGGEDMKVSSIIDGITEKGYTTTLKIETKTGDISGIKKDIWVLLGEKMGRETVS